MENMVWSVLGIKRVIHIIYAPDMGIQKEEVEKESKWSSSFGTYVDIIERGGEEVLE